MEWAMLQQRAQLRIICDNIFTVTTTEKFGNLNSENDIVSLDVSIPGYRPKKDDEYACVSAEITIPGFVTKFTPIASADRTHHILVYGCNEPHHPPGEIWNCEHERICNSPMKILYAWARNAPSFSLPDGVGVPVGNHAGVGYVVLQVHYSQMFNGQVYDNSGIQFGIINRQPKYVAGVYLFASSSDVIPANTEAHYVNFSCAYSGSAEVYPFAFRTHTHGLGRVVSSYKYDVEEKEWAKIGKGNPQWPQAFYPVEKPVSILPGDVLAAQCVFSSKGHKDTVSIGTHGHDEMCNFYMYYYVDAKHRDPFKPVSVCTDNQLGYLFATYPPEASKPFGSNPVLEDMAKQGNVKFGAVENRAWLPADVAFGQISGLTFDNKGNVLVFHRASRVWNENTFDETNRFRERISGPIMDDTVFVLAMGGNVISRWGKGFFYMPHGIFMDKDGFLWATDVALHQVFKFDMKQPASKPLLTLGIEFEPGVDERHFCKPADVAVAADGTILVADGYCNNRIVKFDRNGAFVTAWGESSSEILPNGYPKLGSFALPHSLSIHDPSQRLFVADRENGRAQVFFYNGSIIGQLSDPSLGSTVYSVAYCEPLDTVFLINGPSISQTVDMKVFAFDGSSRRLMYSWVPQSGAFLRPHTLAVSKDCAAVFVGETGPNKLWRFDVSATDRRASLNAARAKIAYTGIRKPNTANDGDNGSHQSVTQMVMILSMAIALPVLVIAAICLCIKFKKRGGFRAMSMTASYNRSKGNKKDTGRLPLLNGVFRDRNGFQRLSTEDVDAMDEITDESETEDMLYPVNQRNSTLPQKA